MGRAQMGNARPSERIGDEATRAMNDLAGGYRGEVLRRKKGASVVKVTYVKQAVMIARMGIRRVTSQNKV